jgi:hypothetical protein
MECRFEHPRDPRSMDWLRRLVARHSRRSPLRTAARTLSRRRSPRFDHCICCFLTIRRATANLWVGRLTLSASSADPGRRRNRVSVGHRFCRETPRRFSARRSASRAAFVRMKAQVHPAPSRSQAAFNHIGDRPRRRGDSRNSGPRDRRSNGTSGVALAAAGRRRVV